MANQVHEIQRLVYPPKVWAFVKNIHGEILDLTEFIVSGTIQRKERSVSSAEIKLRNPEMRFTTRPDGQSAAFHPMDPITIFMTRLPGHHVQVFTGYLDTTPYLQLIPGIVTLKASCTLKRLQYNYFNMAQRYTLEFFRHYGWIPVGNTGTIGPEDSGGAGNSKVEKQEVKKWEKEEEEHKIDNAARKKKEEEQTKRKEETEQNAASAGNEGLKKTNKGKKTVPIAKTEQAFTEDQGSFTKMIAALLWYIADWRDENIYIEKMPQAVPELIASLWAEMEDSNESAKQELEVFWSKLIGTASQGSGGVGNSSVEGTGDIKDPKKVVNTMRQIAEKYNIPPALVIATSLSECGFNQSEINSYNSAHATGWFQFTSATPYPGITLRNYPQEARDTAQATNYFCQAMNNKRSEWPSKQSPLGGSAWNDFIFEKVQVAGSGGYPEWASNVRKAENDLSKYTKNIGPRKEGVEGESEEEEQQQGHGSKSKASPTGENRIGDMEKAAKEITQKNYQYSWGGGHAHAGEPAMGSEHENGGGNVGLGFDCSGSVGAVLAAGGYIKVGSEVPGSGSFGQFLSNHKFVAGPAPSGEKPSVEVYYSASHAYILLNGNCFSTAGSATPRGGAGLTTGNPEPTAGFQVMHLKGLNEAYKYTPLPLEGGNPNEPGNEAVGPAGAAEAMTAAKAAAFLSNIQYPSSEEMAEALIIGGQKALMNAVPVFQIIQQVCEASLRSFMSLPNGDFFAFYPDYFGEFGVRKPYWEIHNIEVLDGEIELSDENLATHVFAVGNTTWPADVPIVNEINAGAMTIFEAFTPGILHKNAEKANVKGKKGEEALKNKKEAIGFLKRYGARPLKLPFTTVYSTTFEQLLAFQQFMIAWSRQFKTTFAFTFMPEIFPGGRVAFPETGIQCYVESVTHTWDLEGGFRTIAELTAPTVYKTEDNAVAVGKLPDNMPEALMEPQRKQVKKGPTSPKQIAPPSTHPIQELESERAKGEAFGPPVSVNPVP